jgi:hypothetical protein
MKHIGIDHQYSPAFELVLASHIFRSIEELIYLK